jgi:hypothetical protein
VRIVRFDEEVSIRITNGGSRFGIGPLTGPGSQVLVHVVHLPPGGSVARHVTPGRQLFAVVAGSGWVAGDMDVYVDAKAGLVAELLARAHAERDLPPEPGVQRRGDPHTGSAGQGSRSPGPR